MWPIKMNEIYEMNEIREKKKEYYIKKKILCSQQLNQIYNEIINEKENILRVLH